MNVPTLKPTPSLIPVSKVAQLVGHLWSFEFLSEWKGLGSPMCRRDSPCPFQSDSLKNTVTDVGSPKNPQCDLAPVSFTPKPHRLLKSRLDGGDCSISGLT